jgi:hypothetical protein
VLTLPDVLAGLSEAEAARLWWFQTKMNFEMIFSGVAMAEAFETIGVDQAAMNMQGFRYHAEILKRMKKEKGEEGKGADSPSIKGLLRFSKKGQAAFQEFLFPTKPRSLVSSRLYAALESFSQRSDAWLASRAPAT